MRRLLAMLAALMLLPIPAGAEDTVWTLVTAEGEKITAICYEPEVGDQYISGDNRLYEVVRVEGDTAILEDRGRAELPDISWLDAPDAAQAVSAGRGRRIALYCTHSDESYEPSDGTYSNDQRGSIYEVAHTLANALTDDGVQAEVSDALHHPHDAGAYRRSRQTAVELLKSVPDALLIPANALFRDSSGKYVYVYEADGETRVRRSVETGVTTDWQVQITDGLEEGEIVYVAN